MGDRTHVSIEIRNEFLERAAQHEDFAQVPEYGRLEHGVDFEFEECNYGDTGAEQWLRDNGIPYDKQHGSGGEYREGYEYVRYTDAGEIQVIEYEEGEDLLGTNQIRTMLKAHEDPAKALAFLHEYLDAHDAKFTPLPWDNQERNAARFLAKQVVKQGAS